MTRTSVRHLSLIFVVACAAPIVSAQMSMQPTPLPTVFANNEPWFVNHQPVPFGDTWYYPGGPAIHFIADEMVPSGTYKGIPLYSRTTIEPNSIVFVPLSGGIMQPYERRRDGDLTGTTGSSVPAFPIEIPSAFAPPPPLQAPAPPMLASQAFQDQIAAEPETGSLLGTHGDASAGGRATDSPQRTVGTAGWVAASRPPVPRRRDAPNAIFVEYAHARWFSSAPPRRLPAADLTLVGEWRGFPVYHLARGSQSTIYIPIALGIDAYAAYSRKD